MINTASTTGTALVFPRFQYWVASQVLQHFLTSVYPLQVPEVTDGSCLSQQPIRRGVRAPEAVTSRDKPPVPVVQPAAALAGVHGEYSCRQNAERWRVAGLTRVFVWFCS